METTHNVPCNCPECGSENIQSAVMVVEAGTTETLGSAVGVSGEGGVGIGLFQGRTVNGLAGKLGPGAKPSSGLIGLICTTVLVLATLHVLIGEAFSAKPDAGVFKFALVPPSLFVLALLSFLWRKRRRRQWAERAALCARQWVCFKCGTVWTI